MYIHKYVSIFPHFLPKHMDLSHSHSIPFHTTLSTSTLCCTSAVHFKDHTLPYFPQNKYIPLLFHCILILILPLFLSLPGSHTLPQSLFHSCFLDIMLVFFLVMLIFSPAAITSELSVLQLGQYLYTYTHTNIHTQAHIHTYIDTQAHIYKSVVPLLGDLHFCHHQCISNSLSTDT